MTIYHLILEATLGLTTFEFSTRFMERESLLPGFVAGYTKIHHDEHRHIGYGIWFLRQAVAENAGMGDVVRETLRDLLPAVAESLTPPDGSRRVRPGRIGGRAARLRTRRPDPPAEHHRRASRHPLSQAPGAPPDRAGDRMRPGTAFASSRRTGWRLYRTGRAAAVRPHPDTRSTGKRRSAAYF